MLTDFITCLKNYFKIQLISSFFGPKREIFDFLNCMTFICFLLFCLIQYFFEESCLFFILNWSLSDFLTSLKNYFQIQLIWPFLGQKGKFWFFDLYEISLFLLFCLKYRIFLRMLSIFHFNLIIIWFSYKFNELFPNSVNLTLFRPKREIFDFLTEIFWNLFSFAFLSYTRFFWRTLSIFHLNLIVIWFSYMFKELFQNSANFILFWAKKGDFWFFDLYEIYLFLLFCLIQNFLKNVVYFSFKLDYYLIFLHV